MAPSNKIKKNELVSPVKSKPETPKTLTPSRSKAVRSSSSSGQSKKALFQSPRANTSTLGLFDDNEDKQLEPVQTLLHKAVNYKVAGNETLSAVETRLMEHILQHFVIPEGSEFSGTKLGPISDTSHEKRVIAAYNLDLLERKGDGAKEELVKLCVHCAATGHKSRYCKTRIEERENMA